VPTHQIYTSDTEEEEIIRFCVRNSIQFKGFILECFKRGYKQYHDEATQKLNPEKPQNKEGDN